MNVGIYRRAPTVDDLVGEVRSRGRPRLHIVLDAADIRPRHAHRVRGSAREVPGIHLGTAVVPIYREHPMALAQQALTVSQVNGGRVILGIGLSHQVVVESMWGLSYARPLRHMRYLWRR